MSFVLDDKKVQRAGLDYWPHLDLVVHASLAVFEKAIGDSRLFLFTTKGSQPYTDIEYRDGDVLVFGSESKGLPQDFMQRHAEKWVTIPMPGQVRSLNLANSAAVAAYEAYRQIT